MPTLPKRPQFTFDELRAYLAKHVDVREDGHHIWMLGCDRNGLPRGYDGKWRGAHRLAWENKYQRRLPQTVLVLITCGEQWCVNPDHAVLSDKYPSQLRRTKGVKRRSAKRGATVKETDSQL